eukprot:CAMPEP_0119557626 /NCGR_PEP_ID=MMETSP1352-20130426/9246_1 /TAXON_ID=265584 /ORGANISM="Stauroneis constricta, Strain CCMP1120" /LENGTH=609 /DNA_ID=CAMNT_0007604763 /DNA_START=120 /DNA_END=1950 /DNA_ORIENTATION=+
MADILSFTGSDVNERAVAKAALDAAEEQLRSLCAAHASTFVAVERRGQAVQTSLKTLLEKIEASENQIVEATEALEQEDEEGEGTLAALSEKHRVRRRTLLQHSHLLELLELPSLMDACVRSNSYDDALSIAAFSNTLERRHTEKNQVVLRVIEQIRSRQLDLRRHLLHSLKSYVTMPQCLEIVTALRRLNSIDLERRSEQNLERTHDAMELSLQVDFLEARDFWLEKPGNSDNSMSTSSSLLNNRGGDISVKSSEQLLDAIERHRTRVFEIATQFNAIFRTQMGRQKGISVSLLSMWTSRKVEAFMTMLAAELEKMKDSAQLRDALEACIFFAASMGRLGADFTPQLPPLFEKKMHDIVKQNWKDGVKQLAETLKACRGAGMTSPLVSSSHVDDDDDGNANADSGASTEATSASAATMDGPPAPPRQLMAFPPLARVVNAFLTGMNELRRCLLPGTFKPLRESMQTALKKIMSILHSNERAVLTPGLRGNATQLRKIASDMRKMFNEIMSPYLQCALEFALGNTDAAWELHKSIKTEKKEEEAAAAQPDQAAEPAEGTGAGTSEEDKSSETKTESATNEIDAADPASEAPKATEEQILNQHKLRQELQ